MEKHYWKMIGDTQERVAKSLQIQVLDRESPRYGGFADPTGIVQAKFSIYRVASMTAAYCNEDTSFYHDERVLESILLGLDYIRRVQHESGLFDYITCNFFSAPDTAFCIKKLIPVYQYLAGKAGEFTLPGKAGGLKAVRSTDRRSLPEGERKILEQVEQIVRLGAEGMLAGGFHTPNHRWAIASVLMTCGRMFDSREMEQAKYLFK